MPPNVPSDDAIADAQAPAGDASLTDVALSGARWVVIARVASETLAFAAAVVLARLLPPAAFGHATVALALVPLSAILTFEGCASVLVQRPQISEQQQRAAVMLSLVLGTVLSLGTLAVSLSVARRVFGGQTAALLTFISPIFVVASVGAVPRALLWRRLDFRRSSVTEVVGLLVGSMASVALAVAGLQAGAIIGGALANTACQSALFYRAAPFRWRLGGRGSFGDIGGFGIPAAFAGLVHVGFANADYVLLAAKLSALQTGLYWRAFQIGVSYQEKVSGIMVRLAFPVYSRTEDRDELRRFHERASRLHAATLVPLLAILIVTAPVLVPWLFGPAWKGAVLPSQLLAIAGMVMAVLTGYPQVMLAVGRPRALLRFNVGILVFYVVVVLAALSHGLEVICLAVVGAHLVILVVVYKVLLGPYVGVPMRRIVTDLGPAVTGSAALLAVGFPLLHALRATGLPAPVLLVATGVAALVVYAAVIRVLFPGTWADVARLARRVAPERAPSRRVREDAVLAVSSTSAS